MGSFIQVNPAHLYYIIIGSVAHLFNAPYVTEIACDSSEITDDIKKKYLEYTELLFLKGLKA